MNTDETAGRETLISEIIAAYYDARETGVELKLEDFLARYPQFEKELRRFFENQAFLGEVLSAEDRTPNFGDDYEVLGEIGRGGMGIVYRVHHKSLDKIVAVKTITGGPSATAADIEGIRQEAQRAARLRHPHIVTVHHVDEHEGQHFFVMEYIEGQSLAEFIGAKPMPEKQAAHYVKTLADAIHYAHQRQILHCDLKPANILLDEEGKPYVSDFGLAKRLGENGRPLPSGTNGGTLCYMAPEQAAQEELTTATDVYGLGAILYALLTGSPPFRAKTLGETLKQVLRESPRPARDQNPAIDKDLDAICLKCLSKDKDQRYGSAYGISRDLERYEAGEETTARPWGRRERAVRWCRRNPVVAGLASVAVVIAIMTVFLAFSFAQDRIEEQRQAGLQSTSFAAEALARTALLQLRDVSDGIEVSARDKTLSDLLARQDYNGLSRYVGRVCEGASIPFVSCFVLNTDGRIVARVREDGQDEATDDLFDFRDYFRGAMAHHTLGDRAAVHVSKVYRSRIDDFYKFVISAPILGRDGTFLGVISVSVATDVAFGLVTIDERRFKVAIIAPKDIESSDTDPQTEPARAVILFHPGYKQRGAVALDYPSPTGTASASHARELDDSQIEIPPSDDYADPVATLDTEYAGRWIAGFAPVGNTGFLVVVQERYEEALELKPSTWRNLLLWSLVVVILAAVMVVLVLSRPHRTHRV